MLRDQHTSQNLSNTCKDHHCLQGLERTAYLGNSAVSMTMHKSCKLHYPSIPAIICTRFAQHDLRYSQENLANTFASCNTMMKLICNCNMC